MANLTLEQLHSLLYYDKETGEFVWKVTRGKRMAGEKAGSLGTGRYTKGYIFITISGRKYRAHRLAWFYSTGEWPIAEIDHINGNPSDNRLLKIREATHSQNMMNARPKKNVTGFKGVKIDPKGRGRNQRDRYIARIREKHIGSFDTAEEAYAAYCAAAKEQFGEFARTE